MKPWLKTVLKIAGIYNVLWGTAVVFAPNLFFDLVGIDRPVYPMIWQSVGMIVGVYGVGYYLAARDYVKHYLIVLVGYLGKLFGPIGVFYMVLFEGFPVYFFMIIAFNDLIWWYPFITMLKEAYKEHKFTL